MRFAQAILFGMCITGAIGFAVQEPNSIDFKDPFYTEVLKASVDEAYLMPSGEIPNYIISPFQNAIIKEAELAKQQHDYMVSQWAEPNLPPYAYQAAALSILSHLELNEKRLLTFGLVINTFGIPDAVVFNAYCSDENGTIETFERFVAVYRQKDVAFKFSASGFCCAIHIYSSVENKNKIRWPQKYSYLKQHPVLYRFTQQDELYISLCKTIEKERQEKSSYYDWVGYMEQWPKDHKVPAAEYELEIMMVDHVLDDLAIACLKIKRNRETLCCGTWWKYEGDQWVLLNDEQVTFYFSHSKLLGEIECATKRL